MSFMFPAVNPINTIHPIITSSSNSSYSSFCIPSRGSMTITNGHVPALLMDYLQREIMKNKPRNSCDVWGKVAPRCFPASGARNSTNVNPNAG
ncbi:hypothetical protein AVEN_24950-1 [Araneus ventricosus]|uniref:Uncharacterized protein n=1 Tax=Araneus ventricosus TaxID=182803 RepID=A0A4Y2G4I4_ARAVE|nr:hypothetical protein AVEN_24950-1 [Araneus ventricosus]